MKKYHIWLNDHLIYTFLMDRVMYWSQKGVYHSLRLNVSQENIPRFSTHAEVVTCCIDLINVPSHYALIMVE